uniref:U6 snRNA-associated Sm-like protein LSm3 n=1 Tax=Rhabditophanes sp. KR3021 TaxID=114890 RepID=A0AC35TG43_9BILA
MATIDVSNTEVSTAIENPLDLIRLALNEKVLVKMRAEREIVGTLHAFDQHLNMILADAEETVTITEIEEDQFEEVYKQEKRTIPMLFLRGDSVILVSPILKPN